MYINMHITLKMHFFLIFIEIDGKQNIRVAVRLLLVSLIVVHVESHFTHLTMEASFVPILQNLEKQCTSDEI